MNNEETVWEVPKIKTEFTEKEREQIDEMRRMISKNFGVTVVHDDYGEFGPNGVCYVTLRWYTPPGKKTMAQITMAILNVD